MYFLTPFYNRRFYIVDPWSLVYSSFFLKSLFYCGALFCVIMRNYSKDSNHAAICCQMMKSYIWIQTTDGAIQQVEQEVAMFCPMICQEVIQKGMGSSKNCAISLPQRVTPAMLSLILDYCRFHQVAGRSNKVSSHFWRLICCLLALHLFLALSSWCQKYMLNGKTLTDHLHVQGAASS